MSVYVLEKQPKVSLTFVKQLHLDKVLFLRGKRRCCIYPLFNNRVKSKPNNLRDVLGAGSGGINMVQSITHDNGSRKVQPN